MREIVNIIETNLSCDNDWHIKDHQSRMIEVPTWEEYISLFKNYDGVASGRDYKCITNMDGCVLPHNAKLLDKEFDEFHLKCKMKLFTGFNQIKLAYMTR